MMIYKIIFFLPFLLFGNFVKSQVTISVNSNKKLDTITFQINQFDKIILLVDKNNQVSRICNVKNGKLNGFQYYLNKYFLDSLVKFSNDLPTKEKYISSKTGELSKIYRVDGLLLDSTYLKKSSNKPSSFIGIIDHAIFYEYDSSGRFNKISEVDSSFNKIGESIELDNSFRIFQVRSYGNNISVFFVSDLRYIVVGDFNLGGEKYELTIKSHYNKHRTICELRIELNNYDLNNVNVIKTFKVRKNGKVKGAKANSKLVF